MLIHITSDNYDSEVENAELPILLDFWAEWCGPCRMLAPTLERFAAESEGKLNVGKINVDEEPDLARRFNVMSIPTLIVMRGGQATAKQVGAIGIESLRTLCD